MILKKYFLIFCFIFLLIPAFSHAFVCAPDASGQPTLLCNPLGSKDPATGQRTTFETFKAFAIDILGVFAGAASITTITYVVFSGFRFLISQGNSEDVETAKRSLQWSLSGLALMLLSYVLVTSLQSFLGVKYISPDLYTTNPQPTDPLQLTTFGGLYVRLITGFFGVVFTIALFILILNGARYLTAGGNDEQTETAKSGLLYAVIGIAIVVFAYVLVRATATFLGAKAS